MEENQGDFIMTLRLSRTFALLVSLLLVFLCACSPQQPAPDPKPEPSEPSSEDPLPQPQPQPTPEDDPLPQPAPDDEITGENTSVAEGIWKIDTSYFTENRLVLDSFFVAGNDRVLLFVSPLNDDGTVSESSAVYFFSLSTGHFLSEHLDLGVISMYPDRVYDDGTVSVVTMDSESYQFRDIVFIDPQAISMSSVPVPSDSDIISLSVSPDKQHVAVTTLQGLNITSLDFSSVSLQIPNEQTSDGDELCPSPSDWSADSRQLSFKTAMWESILFPSIADVQSGAVTELDMLSGSEVYFAGGDLFYSSWFPYLPCGFCAQDGSGAVQTPLSCVPEPTQLCVFSPSPARTHLALAIQTESGCSAMVADARSGEVLSSLSLPDASFHEAFFTSDERTAVFSTASTLESPKELYVMDFGW